MYFEVRSMRSSLHNQVIVQYFRLWFVLCVICFIKTCTYLRIEPTRLQGSIERSIKQLTFNHLSENFFPFPSRCRSLQSQIRYTVSIKFPSGKHCTSIVLKTRVHYSTIEKCSHVMLPANSNRFHQKKWLRGFPFVWIFYNLAKKLKVDLHIISMQERQPANYVVLRA